MYYIEGDHEAIIDPDVFEMVQQEFARRKSGGSHYSDEMTEIAEAVEKAMIENSRIALDQEEYRRKNDELALKFDNAKMKYEELECKIFLNPSNSRGLKSELCCLEFWTCLTT